MRSAPRRFFIFANFAVFLDRIDDTALAIEWLATLVTGIAEGATKGHASVRRRSGRSNCKVSEGHHDFKFGATGARILSQTIKEMVELPRGSRAIVRICADGGQGSVALLERA